MTALEEAGDHLASFWAEAGPSGAARLDYQVAWQHAACAHLVLDAAGTITHVNETFLSWTGHSRDAVVGAALTALLPIGDRILYSTHCMPQLSLTGRVEEVSLQVLDAVGDRHAALLTATQQPADQHAGTAESTAVALFSAGQRRRYEEDLLAARRRAEASEAERARAEAGLQHLVLHDSLTGLANRSGLLGHLHTALQAPRDRPTAGGPRGEHVGGQRLTLFYLDLDGFKAVNDSLGHAAGDDLLIVVAARLQAASRPGTVIARLAGDEFAVLERIDPRRVGDVAQRFLDVLCAPIALHGVEVVITASIGIAVDDVADPVSPADPAALTERVGGDNRSTGSTAASDQPRKSDRLDTAQDRAAVLLRLADAAMYTAKGHGRARWHRHAASDGDPTADRLQLVAQLRSGIHEGQLRLHYQPRVDLSTGCVDSVEALVRWDHPVRGLLPPAAFIAVAEESGLIRELGSWVLEEALRQLVRWDVQSRSPLMSVAVNLSARQLADPLLLGKVSGALARYGLDPSRLVLEITETALMVDPESALATMRALRDLGVHLAVDDFGTGYSSLTYLKQFPVDEIKIDRSFVAGLTSDPADRAIVSSCIQLARALGMTSVAEGVETAEQRLALLELGCDLVQGYLFGRPAPSKHLPVLFTPSTAGALELALLLADAPRDDGAGPERRKPDSFCSAQAPVVSAPATG